MKALRIFLPRREEDWPAYVPQEGPGKLKKMIVFAIGPNDTRRLFTAAVNFYKPGYHLIHASGDIEGKQFPNKRVNELLGWLPEGR